MTVYHNVDLNVQQQTTYEDADWRYGVIILDGTVTMFPNIQCDSNKEKKNIQKYN